MRFASDPAVYEEILGPGIWVPEPPPRPSKMSQSDLTKYVESDLMEHCDVSEVLRFCRAFSVVETKTTGDGVKVVRRRDVDEGCGLGGDGGRR